MITFEWEKGAIFPSPLNTWHRYINTGKDPARLAAITNAPLLIDMFRHTDFIFDNDYVFTERFDGRKDYFSPKAAAFLSHGPAPESPGLRSRPPLPLHRQLRSQCVEGAVVSGGPGSRGL